MSQPSISRRQLLKIVAAAAGTAVLSSVPNKWETPVVDVGMLPAHAQGLSGNGAIDGYVVLQYTFNPTGTNSPANNVSVRTISPLVINGLVGAPVPLAGEDLYHYTINNVPAGIYTVQANSSCGGGNKSGVGVTAGATTMYINFSFLCAP